MSNVELDSKGIAELLKSDWAASIIEEPTRQIAANVRGQVDAEVEVTEYTTDRRAASVTVKHPTAMGMQARDGILTKAAAGAGLEVKAKP